jgi:hypothetical protein
MIATGVFFGALVRRRDREDRTPPVSGRDYARIIFAGICSAMTARTAC